MPKPIFPRAIVPLSEKDFAKKYADRVRVGKTAKDKASGSWGSRFSNREARVAWQHDPRAKAETFPGKN